MGVRATLAGIAIGTLLVHSLAAGQELSARARVDSTNYLVGDWIGVAVSITHPPGATFQALVGDTLGGYTVLDRSPMERVDDTTTLAGLTVARYDSGTAVLPSIPYLASIPGDTVARTVATNALVLTVRTLPVQPGDEIKDLKPPLSVPYTLVEILLLLAVIVAVVGLAYLLYRRFRRKDQSPIAADLAPARPAHVIALAELAVLKEKRLWQQGRIKEYYTEVTDILRRYFENRYGVKALEATTDEILSGLKHLGLRSPLLGGIDEILRRADLVKFAKHQPALAEHEVTLNGAFAFVTETKVRDATPSPSLQARTPTHVGT